VAAQISEFWASVTRLAQQRARLWHGKYLAGTCNRVAFVSGPRGDRHAAAI